MNANAASVYYIVRCGTLGHLWLTLKPEIYNTLTADPFEPPENPGPQPVIPERATAPQIASIVFHFQADQLPFQSCTNVEQALKSQLVAALDEIFI